MPSFLVPFALLACPVGMGLMMFFMMRGNRQGMANKGEGSPEERLKQLEAEKRALELRIASPEGRLAQLEAEKRALERQLVGDGTGRSKKSTTGNSKENKLSAN